MLVLVLSGLCAGLLTIADLVMLSLRTAQQRLLMPPDATPKGPDWCPPCDTAGATFTAGVYADAMSSRTASLAADFGQRDCVGRAVYGWCRHDVAGGRLWD